MKWTCDSWKNFEVLQQPVYSNTEDILNVTRKLKSYPGIVDNTEISEIKADLINVHHGKSFILQGGDCAESFVDFKESILKNYFRLFLQMNIILMCGMECPIVKIGRIAGQYAKPRSSDVETIDGITLPSYKGDIINSIGFTKDFRACKPQNMIDAYFYAAASHNYIQKLATCGFASLEDIDLTKGAHKKYPEIVDIVNKNLKFIKSCGMDNIDAFQKAKFYTSHETLLLPYEESLIRVCDDGKNYSLSAHQLWIGDRTRKINSAHIEFVRGLENPIGIKIGPTTNIPELLQIIEKVNPENEIGKIILIARMGAEKISDILPTIIINVQKSGMNVIWQSDPMHGNIIKSTSGYKTRQTSDIFSEWTSFVKIHKAIGTYAGGVHLEMTGENVTECIDDSVLDRDLSSRYMTHCDPRLNAQQSLEFAFQIVDLFKQ